VTWRQTRRRRRRPTRRMTNFTWRLMWRGSLTQVGAANFMEKINITIPSPRHPYYCTISHHNITAALALTYASQIDFYGLRLVCKQTKRWRNNHHSPPSYPRPIPQPFIYTSFISAFCARIFFTTKIMLS